MHKQISIVFHPVVKQKQIDNMIYDPVSAVYDHTRR